MQLPHDAQRGEQLVSRGENLVYRGETLVSQGQQHLAGIPEYKALPGGRHNIDDAEIGERAARLLRESIALGEEQISNGERIIESGQELIQAGRAFMPSIPRTPSLQRYFEELARLAIVRDTITDADGSIR